MRAQQRILVIDDDPPALHVIARMVRAGGYDAREANRGRAALEAFAAERPDLVLCDLRLPDIDGLEILKTVVSQSPLTPFILMSGVGQINDAVEALRLGAWDYLIKPIHSVTALTWSIEKALGRAELMIQNATYRQQLEHTNVELEKSVVELEREIDEHRRTHRELLAAQAEARSLALQLAVTEEKERRRIAVHLHEHVAQILAMSQLKLHMLQEQAHGGDVAQIIVEVTENIREVIAQLRSLTFDLFPPALADMGLAAAVVDVAQRLVTQSRQPIVLEVEEGETSESLTMDECAVVYRAARELIWNALKHARATRMKVAVGTYDGRIRVEVVDNGIGLDRSEADKPAGADPGIGLPSVRERVRHLGGEMHVVAGAMGGVRATLIVPVCREEGDARRRHERESEAGARQ